jgi:hypothetical protein
VNRMRHLNFDRQKMIDVLREHASCMGSDHESARGLEETAENLEKGKFFSQLPKWQQENVLVELEELREQETGAS